MTKSFNKRLKVLIVLPNPRREPKKAFNIFVLRTIQNGHICPVVNGSLRRSVYVGFELKKRALKGDHYAENKE